MRRGEVRELPASRSARRPIRIREELAHRRWPSRARVDRTQRYTTEPDQRDQAHAVGTGDSIRSGQHLTGTCPIRPAHAWSPLAGQPQPPLPIPPAHLEHFSRWAFSWQDTYKCVFPERPNHVPNIPFLFPSSQFTSHYRALSIRVIEWVNKQKSARPWTRSRADSTNVAMRDVRITRFKRE